VADAKATKAESIKLPPAGRDVRAYIEDQLDTLAQLASARGERRLAVALQLAALEAARTEPR
jgi:hypothetical protein